MTCEEVLLHVRDYVDRELKLGDVERVEAHVAVCSACAERIAAERDLKCAIGAKIRLGPAPPGLAAAITHQIRAEAGIGNRTEGRPGALSRRVVPVLTAAACGLLAAGLLVALWLGLPWRRTGEERPSRLTAELIDDHIRYLAVEQPSELVTSDPAEAEQWFRSRLDVAVSLPRFKENTLALRGARLCYILDRRIALLGYERGTERLSLFVMDASGLDFQDMKQADVNHVECVTALFKGYKVLCWKRYGLLFAFVVDDGEDGLEALVADAYRQ